MVVLILAIPVLGYAGARTVLNSRAGKVAERNLDPDRAGYVAIVEPTPTTLVVQRDAEGDPMSLTLLALGTGEAGGSILFIPLDTNLVDARPVRRPPAHRLHPGRRGVAGRA